MWQARIESLNDGRVRKFAYRATKGRSHSPRNGPEARRRRGAGRIGAGELRLDEANKLKAAIDLFESGALPLGGDIGPPQEIRQLVGKWNMRTARSNNTRTYRISKDGSVVMVVGKKTYHGKIVKRGDSLFVDFGDNDIDRLTVVGNRMFLEHWRGRRIEFADDVQSGYRVR